MNFTNFTKIINKPFKTFNVRGIQIDTTYWQVFAIVFLIFLLLLTIARMRYLYVHWQTGKSSISFMFWGALLTVILEGFFIIGGRTIFTEVVGWRNAPKPISTFLDLGRSRLAEGLGINKEIPSSFASEHPTYDKMVSEYNNMSKDQANKFHEYVCNLQY